MASFGGAAAGGGSRHDPLSSDRIELLDLDELMKRAHEKKKENEVLHHQLSQLELYISTIVDALRCTEASQLDELLQQLTPHPTVLVEQLVSTQLCRALNEWATADDLVSLHKILGTEMVTTAEGKFIGKIHVYEENYPHLPPKLIVIQKIPFSSMFKVKATEILLHIQVDKELKNIMVRSSEEEMVKCFQEIQSQIFDLVDRDNVFQSLKTEKLLQQTLSCNMSRTGIYFMLPRMKQAGTSFGEITVAKEESYQVHDNSSVASILQNYFSVQLFVEPMKGSGWLVDITCNDDDELESGPQGLVDAMTAFALEVKQGSVTDAVSRLIAKIEQLRIAHKVDSSNDSSNDELGALF